MRYTDLRKSVTKFMSLHYAKFDSNLNDVSLFWLISLSKKPKVWTQVAVLNQLLTSKIKFIF